MFNEKMLLLVKENKRYVFLAGIIIFIGSLLILGRAYLLASIIDLVLLRGGDYNIVMPLFAWLFTVVLMIFILSVIEEKLFRLIGLGIRERLLSDIMTKSYAIGVVSLKEKQIGEYLEISTKAIDDLYVYYSQYIPQLLKAGIIPLTFIVLILPSHLVTGLILLCTTPLIPLFMILIGKWAEAMSKKQWLQLQALSGYLYDIFQGIKTLKLFNRGESMYYKIDKVSDDFRKVTMSALRLSFLSALTLELFTTLSVAIVAVSLGLSLLKGFVSYKLALFLILLAPEYYLPLRNLGVKYHASLNGITSYQTIYDFLNLPENNSGNDMLDGDEFAVQFKNVCYSYSNGDGVDNISFNINSREKVAIIGESGGGKSTIINLLLGYLPLSCGEILINGKRLSDIDIDCWRSKISYVPQSPYIFAGTLKDNILMGYDESRLSRIEGLTVAGFVDGLADGFNTIVGAGGASLSGGEKQLVAMLRAIIKDSPVIVLDEAVANMDSGLKEIVYSMYNTLFAEKTVITITHYLSTINMMDKVIVVKDGKIVSVGTHHELYNSNQYYTSLINEWGGILHE